MITGYEVQVSNLTVRKGGYELLRGISFSIAPGEFVGIVGPNGAGKTTLLNTLCGERPQHGTVTINGSDLYQDPERWLPKMGFVPVFNVLHDSLTVEAALRYAGLLRGIPLNLLVEKIDTLLAKLEISGLKNKQVGTLSSGETKRVNICAELLSDPGWLLLDEPTSNLDPYIEDKLMRLLADLAKQGTTIIIISHTVNTLHHCDRVLFIGNSETVHAGTSPSSTQMEYCDWIQVYGANQTQPRTPMTMKERARRWRKRLPVAVSTIASDVGTLIGNTRAYFANVRLNTDSISGANRDRLIEWVRSLSALWFQYQILLQRQLQLLQIKGFVWPLLFGLASAFLLLNVFSTDSGLHLSFGRPLLESLPIFSSHFDNVTAIASHDDHIDTLNRRGLIMEKIQKAYSTAYLVVLVTFLMGVFGSVREIVDEKRIYLHERRKGLPTSSYVAVKLTVFGSLFGIVAPTTLFVVLNSVLGGFLPAAPLFLRNGFDVWFLLVSVGLTSVAIGLTVSALSSSREIANRIMGIIIVSGAVFSVPDDGLSVIAQLLPTSVGIDALRATTGAYCLEIYTSFPSIEGTILSTFNHYSTAHLLSLALKLTIQFSVAILAVYTALRNQEKWIESRNRLRFLQSKWFVSTMVALMLLLAFNSKLQSLVVQANEQTDKKYGLDEVNPYELDGFQNGLAGWARPKCNIFFDVLVEAAGARSSENEEIADAEQSAHDEVILPTPTVTPTILFEPTVITDPIGTLAPDFVLPSIIEGGVYTPDVDLEELLQQFFPDEVQTYETYVISATTPLLSSPHNNAYRVQQISPGTELMLFWQALIEDTQWVYVGFANHQGEMFAGWINAEFSLQGTNLSALPSPQSIVSDCARRVGQLSSIDTVWAGPGDGSIYILGTLVYTGPLHPYEVTVNVLVDDRPVYLSILADGKNYWPLNLYNIKIGGGGRVQLELDVPERVLQDFNLYADIYILPNNCQSIKA